MAIISVFTRNILSQDWLLRSVQQEVKQDEKDELSDKHPEVNKQTIYWLNRIFEGEIKSKHTQSVYYKISIIQQKNKKHKLWATIVLKQLPKWNCTIVHNKSEREEKIITIL